VVSKASRAALDPKNSILEGRRSVVREWIERQSRPHRAHQGQTGAGELGRVLAGLPEIAARVAVLEATGDHDPGRTDPVAGVRSPRWAGPRAASAGGDLALWIIADFYRILWLSGSYDCNAGIFLLALISN